MPRKPPEPPRPAADPSGRPSRKTFPPSRQRIRVRTKSSSSIQHGFSTGAKASRRPNHLPEGAAPVERGFSGPGYGAYPDTTTTGREKVFSLSSRKGGEGWGRRPILLRSPHPDPRPTRSPQGEGENSWRAYQDASPGIGLGVSGYSRQHSKVRAVLDAARPQRNIRVCF